MFQQNRVGITGTELELEEGASGRFTPISDSGAHDADQFPLAPATYDEPRAEAEMKRSTEALVRDDDAEEGSGYTEFEVSKPDLTNTISDCDDKKECQHRALYK